MSETRKRVNRFPARSEVPWLDHGERESHRNTIKILSSIATTLERAPDTLSPEQQAFLGTITDSKSLDTRLNAAWNAFEKTEAAYMQKLSVIAPFDLTAYHELLNPHEPPAAHHIYLCDHLMRVEAGEIKTLIVAMSPGTAKSSYASRTFGQWYLGRNPDKRLLAVGHAMALDTLVPTPKGFKTVEELQVGDFVFAVDGSPTEIVDKSPIFENHECFIADDGAGTSLVVDGNHLWSLHPETLRVQTDTCVKTTKHLANLKQNSRSFSLVSHSAAQYEKQDLLVDPYTLGLWLGDGNKDDGRISGEENDIDELISYIPYPCKKSSKNKNRFQVYGLMPLLRDIRVLDNKHVPRDYLISNVEQREALLQGLMDSDGSVTEYGDCTFHNTNENLIQSVRELLFSLSIRSTIFEVPLRGAMTVPAWRVHFKHPNSFKLKRKVSRCLPSMEKRRTIRFSSTLSVPTQCITVAHHSHTFLVTRGYLPTHNSQKWAEDELSKPNRNAMDTDLFRLAFPDVYLNPNEKSASFWRLDGWRGSYACRGVGSGVSGLRANLVLGDDLYKHAQDAMSEVIRAASWRWWSADVMSRRLPDAAQILVNCVTGDTPVMMSDGSWKPMDTIKVGDEVMSHADGALSPQKVEHWAKQPDDNILEVHTGNGIVRCNARHPFWARKYKYKGKWEAPAWIKAGELSRYDKVCVSSKAEGREDARLTHNEAWFLGLAFGDGCVSRSVGRPPWKNEQLLTRIATSQKAEDITIVAESFEKAFGITPYVLSKTTEHGTTTTVQTSILKIGRWLHEHGVHIGGTAHTKRVPSWLFAQPISVREAFLDGFVYADGHISARQVVVTLCNEGLTKDIRHLFLSVGRRATSVRKYIQTSTLPKRSREDKFTSTRYRVTYSTNTPIENDAFFFKGVTKIINTNKKEPVYDIQVANTHNFIADGIVVSNTRWHSEDVAGHIEKLDREARQQQVDQPWVINPIPQPCVIINIPAEAKEDDPLGRKPGEWIWCKDQQADGFYPISHYENMRATMPASLWSALYLGEPIDKHGDFVAEDQFQRFETVPANKEGKPREFVKTIMSVDAAQSSKERADNTAILVFRVRVDGVHCLVDQWAGKKNLDDLVQHMSKMMKAWEVNYAIIENSGMGVQLLENYQGKMPAPLVSYTPAGKGSKDFRFDAAVPLIISGKVLFPKQAPWLNDLMAEFISFPNGSNDDRVDAFSQYCDHEMKIRIGGTKSLKMRG